MSSGKPFLVHLPPQTVIRVSGPDRIRYLNGQITQDVRLATSSQAVYSCVLNAKGQLEAVCWVRAHGDSFLLDAPRELREDLMARLDRYLIADEVELRDESDQWHLTHFTGVPLPKDGTPAWNCERSGRPGVDLFTTDPLSASHDSDAEISAAQFESIRIALGIPAWGSELTPGLLPPEAGLEAAAISYDKGCYLGQEVISRMKRAGKTNRHLVRLLVPTGTKAPCTLVHEDKEAGHVTSVAEEGASFGECRALGFRKRKFEGIDRFSLRGPDASTLRGAAVVVAT